MASSAFCYDLQAIIIVAPNLYNSSAVDLPIPILAPVIITILSFIDGNFLLVPPLKYFLIKIKVTKANADPII